MIMILVSFFMMIGGVAAIFIGGENLWLIEVVFLLMGSILIAIFLFPEFFKKAERYRAWGDAVFLLPAICYFL